MLVNVIRKVLFTRTKYAYVPRSEAGVRLMKLLHFSPKERKKNILKQNSGLFCIL